MKLIVGRFGVDLQSGEVQSVSDDGTTLTIGGVTAYADRAGAEMLRQQLTGYVNSPDEPVVPVVWEEQPELTGFYRVSGVTVEEAEGTAWEGLWDFSVSLVRVTGYAAPLIELRQLGARRPSSSSKPGVASYAVPAAARSVSFFSEEDQSWYTSAWAPDNVVRSGQSGDVIYYGWPNWSGNLVVQYFIDPERYYDGAATLLMGDDLSPVVGRQVRNQPSKWRLSNGLYEIESGPGDGLSLRQRMWLNGEWTPWVPFNFVVLEADATTAHPIPAAHSITVLRNSPTEVAIRLETVTPENIAYSLYATKVDVVVRRGARHVSVTMTTIDVVRFAVQSPRYEQLGGVVDAWQLEASGIDGVDHAFGGALEVHLDYDTGIIHPNEDWILLVDRWSFTMSATEQIIWSTVDGSLHQYEEWLYAASTVQAVVVQ